MTRTYKDTFRSACPAWKVGVRHQRRQRPHAELQADLRGVLIRYLKEPSVAHTVEFHGSACGRCNCFRGAADSFNVQRGSTRSVDMLRWNAPVDPRTLAEAHRAVQASKPAPCLRMFGKRPAAAGAPLDLAVAVVFELSCLAEASKTTDTQNSLPPKLTVSPAAFFFRLHHVIIPQSCFHGSGLIRLT